MPFFKKLFGSGGGEKSPTVEPESYEGYTITPTPIREGSTYRVSARIEKELEGEMRTHVLVRADTIGDLKQAEATSIAKAKQMINEQGDRIFK